MSNLKEKVGMVSTQRRQFMKEKHLIKFNKKALKESVSNQNQRLKVKMQKNWAKKQKNWKDKFVNDLIKYEYF